MVFVKRNHAIDGHKIDRKLGVIDESNAVVGDNKRVRQDDDPTRTIRHINEQIVLSLRNMNVRCRFVHRSIRIAL